ncbi:MAG: hypothetical protein LBR48_09925 [Dysgonamonadaceae bacterium]|nr:hypothetical protein [Dysgonamonadaceae bacterium]
MRLTAHIATSHPSLNARKQGLILPFQGAGGGDEPIRRATCLSADWCPTLLILLFQSSLIIEKIREIFISIEWQGTPPMQPRTGLKGIYTLAFYGYGWPTAKKPYFFKIPLVVQGTHHRSTLFSCQRRDMSKFCFWLPKIQ